MADYHNFKRKKPLMELLDTRKIKYSPKLTISKMIELLDSSQNVEKKEQVDSLVDSLCKMSMELGDDQHTQSNSQVQHTNIEKILSTFGYSADASTQKYYLAQPNGSQKSPDFYLCSVDESGTKTVISVECKIGRNSIFWNDGFPRDDVIYVFTCHKYNTTKLILGKDMYTADDRKSYEKYTEIKNKLNKEFREEMAHSTFYPTFRGAWKQNNIDSLNSNIDEIRAILCPVKNCDEHRPKGISLFAGCGGDTLGMEIAGVDVVGFVEIDKNATESHKLNFPNSRHIGTDIIKTSFIEYCGKIDFLFGGFPCQSFSHGGKKDANDPRGQLYNEFVRATKEIQPRWVIGENVKGIMSRKNEEGKSMANIVVEAFGAIGYTMIYQLVNSQKFGVPQSRERVIFVGWKNGDTGIAKILETNNLSTTMRHIFEQSLEDAMPLCEHLKIPENKFVECDNAIVPTGSPPANLVKCAARKTENDDITFRTRGKSTFSCIIDIDDVSRTLICTYAHMPRLFVPLRCDTQKYMRPYTIGECQQIQGFPTTFKLFGNKSDKIKQIGNAVPPAIIAAIVNDLKKIV